MKSILHKINKNEEKIKLIEKAESDEKITSSEVKEGIIIMKTFDLILNKPQDRGNAIVKLQENIRIYRKKIEMYEKRKSFRLAYQKFEFFRGRFYREVKNMIKKLSIV